MAELLKNIYTIDFIQVISDKIIIYYPKFDNTKFIKAVFDQSWQNRELKSRISHIAKQLEQFLPNDYSQALVILRKIAPEFSGLEAIIFPEFILLFGLDDWNNSIPALADFTQYSSSEFAVRPFIERYPKMMSQMNCWAESDNHHIRRLASEGCRPRLPWASSLTKFKKNPAKILPILEKLKADESEYVRKSVANNLNDISKDNPELVLKIAENWLGDNPKTNWIVKHGCRTLLKQGEPKVMQLFGFYPPKKIKIIDFLIQSFVKIGGRLSFSFVIESNEQLGKIRLEYAIYFLLKSGKLSRKVFKISEITIKNSYKAITRSHNFKPISTRKYYPGKHSIGLIINGFELKTKEFQLLIDS